MFNFENEEEEFDMDNELQQMEKRMQQQQQTNNMYLLMAINKHNIDMLNSVQHDKLSKLEVFSSGTIDHYILMVDVSHIKEQVGK